MLLAGRSYESLNDYLSDRIAHPSQFSKRKKTEGTEVIQFDVTPEGELSQFRVINSVSPEIDEHVISVLKTTSGFWTPGENNGEPATMTREISVVFKHVNFTFYEFNFIIFLNIYFFYILLINLNILLVCVIEFLLFSMNSFALFPFVSNSSCFILKIS